ncbi:MAG: ArnT family glycosyltransferase [Polyangiaceae bacterium]|jgi:hypothetical protein
MPASSRPESSTELLALATVSVALLALRLAASGRVGFGDSEALYASYALHPQPGYLDHPGLIGGIARAIGAGTAPTAERAHVVTSVAATLVPWAMVLACRACGAAVRRALVVGLVFGLVPEIAIGLFAMTPDLPLALSWLGTLTFAARALSAAPGSRTASVSFTAAGVLAGIAAASKVTGVLLFTALVAAYASRPARTHVRSAAPWAGLAAGAILFMPFVAFEAKGGWPMLAHRLVDTQHAAGFSLRNAGALVGGQLAYLSPLVLFLAILAAREAWRGRHDAVGALLFAAFAVPLAVLLPLCLWSRSAEPHWLAPSLLALGPAAARAGAGAARRLIVASTLLSGAIVAAVHAWVLIPGAVRLAPATYDPRFDLANELYGWPTVVRAVRGETLALRVAGSRGRDTVVVGPHWVICAQLEAALRGEVPVGCDTPVPDDFDAWLPRNRWRNADSIVWVSDTRFGPPPVLPTHSVVGTSHVHIRRGGTDVRLFTITVFERRVEA